MTDSLRERVLKGDILAGTWLVLGSGLTVEMAGNAGFDWGLIDLEHGMGDLESLLVQLQAADAAGLPAIVRVAWNEPWIIKRVLDLGPRGIMVPMVSDAEQARRAVAAMRYPPEGIRGLTPLTRPAKFGLQFPDYFQRANDELVAIVQIETQDGVDNADEIAAVEGVDCLLIGPMDLSLGMGVFCQFDHPKFRHAVERVVSACRATGKAAGLLIRSPDQIAPTIEDGFTVIAISTDGGELAAAFQRLTQSFEKYRSGR